MKIPLKLSLKITTDAIVYVLRRPTYFLLAIFSTLLAAGLIVWSLNLELLKYIFFEAPLSIWGKIEFFIDGYGGLFSTFNSSQSVSLIIFSILFGINISLLTYVFRHRDMEKLPKKSGGLALGSAVLGGGCIACGTSLLTPLLTTFGITSVAFVRSLGTLFLVAGSILTIYSIYKLALLVANIKARLA